MKKSEGGAGFQSPEKTKLALGNQAMSENVLRWPKKQGKKI